MRQTTVVHPPGRMHPPARVPGGRIDALDGVRAIAVFVVIAFHLGIPGFSAGFLGVDAFFVLSGFLITGLLLADVRRQGRIQMATFWARRVRRLLPAFLVVIGVVIVWGAVASPPHQRDALRVDVITSLLNVANWRFISTASYFSNDGVVSPLQHVWSLAVEEQFYLVWPLTVALVAIGLRMLRNRAGFAQQRLSVNALARLLGVVALGGALLSAVLLAVHFEPTSPDRAYMGTDSRAFEPLLGAALACMTTSVRVRRLATRLSEPAIVVGLAGLGLGVALLGSTGAGADGAGAGSAYYDGGAVAVSIACLILVLGAGFSDPDARAARVLGAAPVAWLGRISYGIYLWHWPLTVWLAHGEHFSLGSAILVAGGSVVAAAVSYYLVEAPIQRGRLGKGMTPRRVALALPLVLLIGVGTAATSIRQPPAQATRLVIVGDSVATRLFPALSEAALKRRWTAATAASGGCPATGARLDSRFGASTKLDCSTVVAARQRKVVTSVKPTLVIWWSRYELADQIAPDGRTLKADTPQFWAAAHADLERSVDRLASQGATVAIVLTDRPGKGMATRCTPANCHPFLRRLVEEDSLRVHWNALVRAEAAKDGRIRPIVMDDLYCKDKLVPCDDSVSTGGYARPDGTHFSATYLPVVSSALLDRVAPLMK